MSEVFLFNNFTLETNNVYNKSKINNIYFESIVLSDSNNDFFSDESNSKKIIQIKESKKEATIYLYFNLPNFLYERSFDIWYRLDERLADILEIKNYGGIHYNSNINKFNKKIDLFNFVAVKINKPKKEIISEILKIKNTEEEKISGNNLKNNQTIKDYIYDFNTKYNSPAEWFGLVKRSIVDKIISRIENGIRIDDLIYDCNRVEETRGCFTVTSFINGENIIKATFINNSLVYF